MSSVGLRVRYPFPGASHREFDAYVIPGPHLGLHWESEVWEGKRFINISILGQPENDGTRLVWYTLLKTDQEIPGALISPVLSP